MSEASAGFADAPPLLGVNIDHVATVRRARGVAYPDPAEAAVAAARGGADFITFHLREDRRHIVDADLPRIAAAVALPLNLEIAATPDMRAVALQFRPAKICLVPERREEVTTEGGLDAAAAVPALQEFCAALAAAGIETSLFVDADPVQLRAARAVGVPAVELHTGPFANAVGAAALRAEREKIRIAAELGAELGLKVNAGHGLRLDNAAVVAALPHIAELNIGHAVVARALFVGMEAATREMKRAVAAARRPR